MRCRLLLFFLLLATGPAAGGEHDAALAARRAGEIAPLDDILAPVAAAVPGRVLGVELDQSDGRYIYELEVLTAAGARVEVKVDAHSNRIIASEAEEAEPH